MSKKRTSNKRSSEPKELEPLLKALANRRRLALLRHIKHNPDISVSVLAKSIRLSIKATSKHLGILSRAKIVEHKQRSLRIFYRLASPLPNGVREIITLL